jgi:hypothetical protein
MQQLLNAIKTTINATSALSPLAGRTYFGGIGRKVTLSDGPYMRVSLLADSVDHAYGKPAFQDHYIVQFSIWATALNTADSLLDNLIAAFNGTTLTLSTDINTHSFRTARGLLKEPVEDENSSPIYQAYCTFEFWDQNS